MLQKLGMFLECCMEDTQYMIKIKRGFITMLYVVCLLHWTVIIFQHSPWIHCCICPI